MDKTKDFIFPLSNANILIKKLFLKILLLPYYTLKTFRYILFNRKLSWVNYGNLKLYLNKNDLGLSRELLLDKYREEEVFEFIEKLKPKYDIIIDVGSNIGLYVIRLSPFCKESGKVISIEPIPDSFSVLKKNIKVNGLGNKVVYINSAVGKDGFVNMELSNSRNLCRVVDSKNGSISSGKSKLVKINSMSLNTIIEKYVVNSLNPILTSKKFLIRMDVEGYEYDILSNAKDLLKSIRHVDILIELHPHLMGDKKTKNLLKVLKNSGFNNVIKIEHNPLYPWCTIKDPGFSFIYSLFSDGSKKNIQYLEMSLDDLISSPTVEGGHYFIKK